MKEGGEGGGGGGRDGGRDGGEVEGKGKERESRDEREGKDCATAQSALPVV